MDAPAFLRPALAGAAATLSGIGLARFAFVPLFPLMVAAGWVNPAGAGLIGAANLAGYLVGALSGRVLGRRLGTARTLDLGMGLAALSFAACAWNGGTLHFVFWRGLAGVAGGLLMALAGPAVQWAVAPSRRGQAGGIVVAGVGTGAILAALLVPITIPYGLSASWLGLSGLVVVLWACVHRLWPDAALSPVSVADEAPLEGVPVLMVAYGLSGAGMVAHMVYLSDLAVHGRGLSPGLGAGIWLLFGIGAVLGTLGSGRVADRLGGARTLTLWLALQVVAVGAALPAWTASLVLSGFLGGFAGVGVSAVGLARSREVGGGRVSLIWSAATASYAVAQAATAFLLAAIFARSTSHAALFETCLALSIAGLVVSAWRPASERRAA